MGGKNKPICPKCKKKKNVVPIIYGLPGPELIQDEEEGKVALGGCCITEDSPEWFCKACNEELEKA